MLLYHVQGYLFFTIVELKGGLPEQFTSADDKKNDQVERRNVSTDNNSVLSNNMSDIKSVTFFMEECKRMQISVLGPDVNKCEELKGECPF